jgi:hypothetical protein
MTTIPILIALVNIHGIIKGLAGEADGPIIELPVKAVVFHSSSHYRSLFLRHPCIGAVEQGNQQRREHSLLILARLP